MYLRVSIEGGPKEEVKIEGNNFSLGRSLKNDISIPHESVSRQHLKIRIERGKFYVTDLDTANGTFMGEEQLIPNEEKEWPVFLPLRLGPLAMVEVLEDEPPPKEEYTEFEEVSEKVNLKFKAGEKSYQKKNPPSTLRLGKETKNYGSKKNKEAPRKEKTSRLNLVTTFVVLFVVYMINDHYKKTKQNNAINRKEVSTSELKNMISEAQKKEISELELLGSCKEEAIQIFCKKIKIKQEFGEGVYFKNQTLYILLNFKERLYNGDLEQSYPFAFGLEKEVFMMSYFLFKNREDFEEKSIEKVYIMNGKNLFQLENFIITERGKLFSFSERDLIQIFTELMNKNPGLFNQLILPSLTVYTSN
jgi:hypothetical protein